MGNNGWLLHITSNRNGEGKREKQPRRDDGRFLVFPEICHSLGLAGNGARSSGICFVLWLMAAALTRWRCQFTLAYSEGCVDLCFDYIPVLSQPRKTQEGCGGWICVAAMNVLCGHQTMAG